MLLRHSSQHFVLPAQFFLVRSRKSIMDSLQSLNFEEKYILAKLPGVAWRLVFGKLGADFAALEACSEATNVFRSLILGNGHVSLGFEKILPSAFCEWIDRSDMKDEFQSEPMLLLMTLVNLKPRISTFEIFVDQTFRPENYVLNSFLKLQSDHLEILYIHCIGVESNPLILDITEKAMTNVRDLKIMRNVSRSEDGWGYQKSLYFDLPEYTSFPTLEKLTLSLEWFDNWAELFLDRLATPTPMPIKHLRFIDATTSTSLTYTEERCRFAISGGLLEGLGTLVSLELPAYNLQRLMCTRTTLKRLTLTLPKWNRHRHVFDMCITGYGEEVCAALFANPTRDPVQVREEIEEQNARQINNDICWKWNSVREEADNNLRRKGLRVSNLTDFRLEVFRIKFEKAEWGPTMVSCADFFNIKGLQILDFCGKTPKHIPHELIQKMRGCFTVLCG